MSDRVNLYIRDEVSQKHQTRLAKICSQGPPADNTVDGENDNPANTLEDDLADEQLHDEVPEDRIKDFVSLVGEVFGCVVADENQGSKQQHLQTRRNEHEGSHS
ncbi:MAG: hypothetical protein Q9171_003620 [Xanthocarpia ochracea]